MGLRFMLKINFYQKKIPIGDICQSFIFSLFYITLIVSDLTPRIIGIDNFNISGKFSIKILELILKLSKKYNKQLFIIIQNYTVLDGIDLFDNNLKLFYVYSDIDNSTKTRHICPPLGFTRE